MSSEQHAGRLEDAAAAAAVNASPQRANIAWLLSALLALACPIFVAAYVFTERPMPHELSSLYINQGLIQVAGDDKAGWAPVQLPFRCQADGESRWGCPATFRFVYWNDLSDDRLRSLYAPMFTGSLSIRLNGVFVATSLWTRPALELLSFIPILVPLPVLQPGENLIEITLSGHWTNGGQLGRFAIGPDDQLRPDYRQRQFLFSALPGMLDGWQFAMGVGLLIMWLARRQESIFLVFGVILLFHAINSLTALLGGMVSEDTLRLIKIGRFINGSLTLPMAWLFVGRRPPIPIWLFLLLPAAMYVSHFTLPLEVHARMVTWVGAPIILAELLCSAWVVFQAAVVQRSVASTLLSGVLLTAGVLGAHDVLLVNGWGDEDDVMLIRFATYGLLAAMSAVVIWRFTRTMNLLDTFSSRLRREVVAAEEALRRSFAREQAQTRAVVLEGERVRLMSDLHDGIAGQLISILAQCELQGQGRDGVAETVRSALADLRLVVASLEDAGEDLTMMLAEFRERIRPQLAALGVTLIWRVKLLPEVAGLHPGATLNIFRILQEAAMNAARHSGADTLTIAATALSDPDRSVRLTVSDCGRGGAAPRTGSRGLGNMRRRAAALNAELNIRSDAEGTTVTLDLPARLP